MLGKPRVFLDTSALFAGIWSSEGGARLLLKLGESGAVQLVINTQVLVEIENTLRSKTSIQLGALAILLDRSRVELVPQAQGEVADARQWIEYPGDAQILASAMEGKIDYFVTLDRKHFLNNQPLRRAVPFLIGTPGDFLSWYRSLLQRITPDRD